MEENTTGFMDKLAEDITNFEVESLLPQLDTVIGRIEFALRLAVMVAPLLILILGLIYYFAPPKEANHKFGYRFYWGMGSVEAWQFTQRLAGAVWAGLGLVLTIVMLIVCIGFRGLDAMAMANAAVTCAVWELVLIGLACIGIDVVVAMRYDKEGNVRKNTRIRVSENFLKLPTKKKK